MTEIIEIDEYEEWLERKRWEKEQEDEKKKCKFCNGKLEKKFELNEDGDVMANLIICRECGNVTEVIYE